MDRETRKLKNNKNNNKKKREKKQKKIVVAYVIHIYIKFQFSFYYICC